MSAELLHDPSAKVMPGAATETHITTIHRTVTTRPLPEPAMDRENHRRSVISLNFAIYFPIPKLYKQSLHPFGMRSRFKEERNKRHAIG